MKREENGKGKGREKGKEKMRQRGIVKGKDLPLPTKGK